MKSIFTTTLLVSAITSITAPTFAQTNAFTPEQEQAIEKIAGNYLLQHPEILAKAALKLKEKQEQTQQNKVITSIKKNKNNLFNNPNTPAAGNKKSNIAVVEFFDYQCGHCRDSAPIVKKLIATNPNIRFIFKEMPIFGGESKYAAQMALAANKQGKYIQFHNVVFSTDNTPLTKGQILGLASKTDLNINKLKKDMQSPNIEQQIKNNFQLAENIGIMGTPAFIIGNTKTNKYVFYPGAVRKEALQQAINSVQG